MMELFPYVGYTDTSDSAMNIISRHARLNRGCSLHLGEPPSLVGAVTGIFIYPHLRVR
jgi:hypothetical protein